eukprot:CAMPEP_0118945354 /NCGR_PEP_ID=MMETSP1169-20130426/42092_1 /TAXON_ID=36882 /ORGANISM="Pyramimonas obovata, Strain CCMP722" /LENGTH=67 /DNA_ID=CAMNT_0006891045 /DNA_START=61 /DNA_END=261 /DNA_ORIENTATION=+
MSWPAWSPPMNPLSQTAPNPGATGSMMAPSDRLNFPANLYPPGGDTIGHPPQTDPSMAFHCRREEAV